jgi:redox-sensitive bicupin YhaK (pirin superfamily)
MMSIRRSEDRGRTKLDWLDSRHTFSFGDYYDPNHMGFGDLRVINEDRVVPAAGFPSHSHRDMEIITYVLEGALAHKDSTGTSSVIRAGEVQRMSAGTGISHSEYNGSENAPVHFLQIWIVPDETGVTPGYEQQAFSFDKHRGRWALLASKSGRDASVSVHQDVDVWAARLVSGEPLTFRLKPGRRAWMQITRGDAALNGTMLRGGDGIAVSEEDIVEVKGAEEAELLLFDLA